MQDWLKVVLAAAFASACMPIRLMAQQSLPVQLNTSGMVEMSGHAKRYLVRHLPVSSFPELPSAVRSELNRRGCLIPQTYEAQGPENVISASLERRGSADWAVLCSAHGTASLLVFFANASAPSVLASAPETERLQADAATGVLGFDWAIGAATPEQVHEAQAGMKRRPPLLVHDALADSLVDQKTVYRYYSENAWVVVETTN
ncbi:MAG TPA: hypothetical protein VHX20_09765 [Terracidiphilus sp.]|jgi:hypothetical protein|nr:hypothetical protein [Terracidiphilus sp.]